MAEEGEQFEVYDEGGQDDAERHGSAHFLSFLFLLPSILIGCFAGYVTTSIEGRVAVEFFDPSDAAQKKKYAFKCHRQVIEGVDTVYPVQGLAFNPVYASPFPSPFPLPS